MGILLRSIGFRSGLGCLPLPWLPLVLLVPETPVAAQSIDVPPSHGVLNLGSVAGGAPASVEVQAGGLINMAETATGRDLRCRGRTDSAPDVVIVNPSPQSTALQLLLAPSEQVALLAHLPDGSYRCSEAGQPLLLPSAQAGEYRVWVLNQQRGYATVSLSAGFPDTSGADLATQLAQQRVEAIDQQTPAISLCVSECNSLLALCEQAIIDVEVACALRARSQRARMVGTTITAVANATQSAEAALVGGAEVAGQAAETRAQRLGCDADMAEFQANCAMTHAACVQDCFTR